MFLIKNASFPNCTTLLLLCSSCCLCLVLLFFFSLVHLFSYISLLSLPSCVAFQERKAQMREPISSVVPPPAAAAPPLAEPSDQRLARPFTCDKNLKVYAAKRTSLYQKPQTHVTCGALIYPCSCKKCLFEFEQPSSSVCVLSGLSLPLGPCQAITAYHCPFATVPLPLVSDPEAMSVQLCPAATFLICAKLGVVSSLPVTQQLRSRAPILYKDFCLRFECPRASDDLLSCLFMSLKGRTRLIKLGHSEDHQKCLQVKEALL